MRRGAPNMFYLPFLTVLGSVLEKAAFAINSIISPFIISSLFLNEN